MRCRASWLRGNACLTWKRLEGGGGGMQEQEAESQDNGQVDDLAAADEDSGSTLLEWMRRAVGRRGIMRARR